MAGPVRCCPLCASTEVSAIARHARGPLFTCRRCALLFLNPSAQPTPEAAERRYRLHRNSIEDEGYVRFLRLLLDPVLDRLPRGARGLDYGSGPAPVLRELASREGLLCDAFDPLFAPVPPRPPYDVVFLCEVAEHFVDPGAEFARLHGLLAPGGLLGLSTEFWSDDESLADWHYLSDPTHLVFYRPESFAWLAGAAGWEPEWSDGRRIVLLRRPWNR